MIKKMLLIVILFTLQMQASVMLERKIVSKSEYTKQIVRCKEGSKSFILIKDDIFYSDRYKKFLFVQDAAEDSCRKKRLRSKKGAIVCVHKKDMYRLLADSVKNKTKLKVRGSCLTLKRSIPLKITNHFPFTSQITYYEIDYKGKKLYISSPSIYHAGKYKSKKSTKKKRAKRKIYKKKSVKKRAYKKQKIKRNNITKPIKSVEDSYNSDAYDYSSSDTISSTTTQAPTIEKPSIDYDTNKLSSQTKKEQYYTYRCVGTYGDNRITVDNDLSMTHASNSVWRRCQALKKDNEVCKITDCYKLIK